jgi:TonB family protein
LRGQGIDLWLAAGIGRAPGAISLPLARYRHMEIHYDAAQRLPRLLGIAYRPMIPDSTIRAGIGTRLAFDFVIDTTGFVDPASIVPLSTEFEAFADEARRTVRASRFAPSMIGRCKVQRRVQLPLDFFLRH